MRVIKDKMYIKRLPRKVIIWKKKLTNTALYPTIKDSLSTQNKQPICSSQLKKERKKWLIQVDVWQKPTQFCKAIILQLKNK